MKINDALITIGIPTYNRPIELCNLLDSIVLDNEVISNCEILIADDGSSSDTENVVKRYQLLYDKVKIHYIRNEVNLGYARNYINLFNLCRTEYLLIIADDNLIFKDGFIRSIEFIKDNMPNFVSSPWLEHGTQYYRSYARLKYNKGTLNPADFIISSDHAPGLIYKCSVARKYIYFLEERLRVGCCFTTVFPQVLLVLNILLYDRGGYYVKFVIGTETLLLESGIKDSSGHYWRAYKSMLRQVLDLHNVLDIMNVPDSLLVRFAAENYFAKYLVTLSRENYANYSEDSIAGNLGLYNMKVYSQIFIGIENIKYNESMTLKSYTTSNVMDIAPFLKVGKLDRLRFDPSNKKCVVSNFKSWLINKDGREFDCLIVRHNATVMNDNKYYFDTHDSQFYLSIAISNPVYFRYSFEIECLENNTYFNSYKFFLQIDK